MKVFISWSGERSKIAATGLRNWLPDVIQAVTPWMSSVDINPGSRWSSDISEQLSETQVGIICLTPENLSSPWVLFEAGALAKALGETLVCPYLIGVEPTDLTGPLMQFQAIKANKESTWDLIKTIAKTQTDNFNQKGLRKVFNHLWPELEDIINTALNLISKEKKAQTNSEMIEETLMWIRNLISNNLPLSYQELLEAKNPSSITLPPLRLDFTSITNNKNDTRVIPYLPESTFLDFINALFVSG